MIVPKKQTGTRKDSKGNDKPVYEPDIPEELEGKKYSSSYRKETDDYLITIHEPVHEQLERVRQESEQRTATVVEEMARMVEEADFSKPGIGQELGQKMRKLNEKK
jgi:hypothetical protein